MRILIAEDDQVLADGLLRSLRSAGYAVDQVGSGSEADAALASHEFDLLILDLGLPKLHGLEVLRKLRARGSSVPVLILTAADSVEQRVKGLTSAPTTTWPSRSRCRSWKRACARSRGAAWARLDRHQARPADLRRHRPRRLHQRPDDRAVGARARLLEVLLQRPGRLVSKDQLVERLCEWGEEVSNNAIEVYIHRLRKKIEQGPIRIATVRGLGYCLEKIPG